MITTANYIITIKVSDNEKYVFQYEDCGDVWKALGQLWHDDYNDYLADILIEKSWPVTIQAMDNGKVIATYTCKFCTSSLHSYFDHGGITLDEFITFIQFKKVVEPERPKNDVTSFFFYMWNAWCKEECQKAFSAPGNDWQHFWNKWCAICEEHSVYGAAERFYAELSNHNRNLLVKRATEVYEGESEKH